MCVAIFTSNIVTGRQKLLLQTREFPIKNFEKQRDQYDWWCSCTSSVLLRSKITTQ